MKTELLSNSQIEKIHNSALQILRNTGIHIPHKDMLARFTDAGAEVDHEKERVYITEEIVSSAIKSAGKTYTIYGRDIEKKAEFGKGKRNYNTIAGEAQWVDKPGGKRRFPSIKDVADAARLTDALENINIAGAMADPHDSDISWRCVEVLAEMVRNTSKPLNLWYYNRASAKFLNEIIIAVRGDEKKAEDFPLCYPFLEAISPLRYPHDGVDLLYETAKLNLPVPIGPMAQMGLSAPMSIAGTMAQEHAEILAGICITQLIRKGMPVCYGGICHAFDMSTTQMIFSGPEQALFGVGMTQMGKYLDLPVYVNVGLTDSKRPDGQAGAEAGITMMLAAAAGADIFGHLGICGVDQATSLDILVLQNEIIGYIESCMRNIEFSDEALGLDVIEDAVNGRDFLSSEHTVSRFRQELWFPKIMDRQYYEPWLESGAKDTEERCRERKEDILANHNPEPVSDELDKELQRIVDGAKKELGEA
ncbi:MAG: trimethylamine methyltransferase family protein [Planctomycetota bacterium]|jgi:trimethylamine--corrinoid protein Co-methyltransferase